MVRKIEPQDWKVELSGREEEFYAGEACFEAYYGTLQGRKALSSLSETPLQETVAHH